MPRRLRQPKLDRRPGALLALALAGCAASPPEAPGSGTRPAPDSFPQAAPSERSAGPLTPGAAVEPDSVFAYLLERYDTDGDGRIARSEYARVGGEFERLDRVPDGQLTDADFASTGRRMRALPPADARRLRSLHLMARYLQADAEPRTLDLDELGLAFAAYDANADGRIGRTEFEAQAPQRSSLGRRPAGRLVGLLEPETTDAWERLADAPDADDDGFLTRTELESFFRSARPDGRWTAGQADLALHNGPHEGAPAPDFALVPPDGGPAVRLSSFAGDRPVALIFGSYT